MNQSQQAARDSGAAAPTRFAGVDSLLCADAFLSPLEIEDAARRALAEDLGRAGDITATATVPADAGASAIVVARKAGVVAGLPQVAAVFRTLSSDLRDRAARARRRRGRRRARTLLTYRRPGARHAGGASAPRSIFSATCRASPPRPPRSSA